MNRISQVTMAIVALAMPAMAAAATDAAQLSDVFVPGTNVEWNDHHLEVFDQVAHRAFHAEWAKREREWLADTESNQPGFQEMRRMWMQERNAQHRAWHRRQAAHENAMSFMEATAPTSTSTSAWTTIVPSMSTFSTRPRAGLETALTAAGDVPLPSRFYDQRKSRRFIRAEAEVRIAADLKALMERQNQAK